VCSPHIGVRNRRLASFVVTLVITGAPFASVTCQAVGAARDAQSTAPHHSCHMHMAAQDGPAIAAIHLCGHDESLPTALQQVMMALDSPAVASTTTVQMPSTRESVLHAAFIDSSPPTPLSPNSQLRI
jgi:hypothetical protein